MTTKCKIFTLGIGMALLFTGKLWAEERSREGKVRGLFLRLDKTKPKG